MRDTEKALNDFIESGALATSQCPNFLRDAYFRAGYRSRDAKIQKLESELTLKNNYLVSAISVIDNAANNFTSELILNSLTKEELIELVIADTRKARRFLETLKQD